MSERDCQRSAARKCTGAIVGAHYGAPVVALVVATLFALHGLPGLEGSELHVVSVALSLDFTLTVPGLVYLLLVRSRRAPWIVLVPAFALGYALARATIPKDQHAVLDAAHWIIVPAEIALVSYLVTVGRRALRTAPRTAGDFATRIRAAARAALGARVPADIVATEVAIAYHALRPRRAAPLGPSDYTSHREVGYGTIVIGLVLLLVVETIPMHVLVSRWGAAAAWILTSLSVYGLLWLVGDLRAMSARPTRLGRDGVSVRVGLRWEAEIPMELIESVESAPAGGPASSRDRLTLSLLGPPNVGLRLRAPVEVTGMYGIRRTTRELWLQMDRAADFRQELSAALASE